MKIGKKFLSLLMGVAVLLVSSLPAFAAEVETTDCASVSYDYVTEFDDGGKDYVYIIDGVKNHYLVPPDDFDPLTATDEELDRYCFLTVQKQWRYLMRPTVTTQIGIL